MSWLSTFKILFTYDLYSAWALRHQTFFMLILATLISGLLGFCLQTVSFTDALKLSWIHTILIYLIAIPEIWSQDFLNGRLDALIARGIPISAYVWARWLWHSLIAGLNLCICATITLVCLGHTPILEFYIGLLTTVPLLTWQGLIMGFVYMQHRMTLYQLALLGLPLFTPLLLSGLLQTLAPHTMIVYVLAGLFLCIAPIYSVLLSTLIYHR